MEFKVLIVWDRQLFFLVVYFVSLVSPSSSNLLPLFLPFSVSDISCAARCRKYITGYPFLSCQMIPDTTCMWWEDKSASGTVCAYVSVSLCSCACEGVRKRISRPLKGTEVITSNDKQSCFFYLYNKRINTFSYFSNQHNQEKKFHSSMKLLKL